MDLACQIPIKKNKTKLKAMSNKLPQYATLARPLKRRQNSNEITVYCLTNIGYFGNCKSL